jgi:hypothetical protein
VWRRVFPATTAVKRHFGTPEKIHIHPSAHWRTRPAINGHAPLQGTASMAQNSKQELATSNDEQDPFLRYANHISPTAIVGTLLKFSKGELLAGKDGESIPPGTRFAANFDALMAGWVKWAGGRPVDHAWYVLPMDSYRRTAMISATLTKMSGNSTLKAKSATRGKR